MIEHPSVPVNVPLPLLRKVRELMDAGGFDADKAVRPSVRELPAWRATVPSQPDGATVKQSAIPARESWEDLADLGETERTADAGGGVEKRTSDVKLAKHSLS